METQPKPFHESIVDALVVAVNSGSPRLIAYDVRMVTLLDLLENTIVPDGELDALSGALRDRVYAPLLQKYEETQASQGVEREVLSLLELRVARLSREIMHRPRKPAVSAYTDARLPVDPQL